MLIDSVKLLSLIAKSGYNETEFIKVAGIGKTTLYRIKNGNSRTNIKIIGKMVNALSCSVEDIIEQ